MVNLKQQGVVNLTSISNLPLITEIKQRELLTEDDVTYVTMNSVFRLNGIIPISASYPGAQSDTPILPQPGKGRRQERIYIDSIGKKGNSLILQENKGVFKASEVSSDVEKLSKFKTETNFKKAVFKFSIDHNLEAKEIIIGVGFGNTTTIINHLNICHIDLVDYFLIVSNDLTNWKIYSNIEEDIFKVKSGKVSIPVTYEVI